MSVKSRHIIRCFSLGLLLATAVPVSILACPPEGYDKEKLLELRDRQFVMSDDGRNRMAIALLSCIGDPRPEIRDGVVFAAYSRWLRESLLEKETILELLARMVPLLAAEDAEGFIRPFAALDLSEVARSDRVEPVFTGQERAGLVDATASYLLGIEDYRGFSDTGGWRHGVAHGADLALQLILNPKISPQQVEQLMSALASQIAPAGEVFYTFGEPSRMARAVFYAYQREDLADTFWDEWFLAVSAPGTMNNWNQAWDSRAGLARRHNVLAFLNAQYINADLAEGDRNERLKMAMLDGLKRVLGGGQESADLILANAKIFTANTKQPWAEAVGIKGDRIIYVGDTAGASKFRSDSTQFIDLDGRLVIPGLVDSHAHPGYIEVEKYGEITATGEEEMLTAVKDYAESHPGEGWLRLCCWPIGLYVEGSKGPDKRVLDAVVADRPVWFVSEWWHSGWLNSRALEVLAVDKNTPDPMPGVASFARDEYGEPTGWVKEGAGWQFFAEHFPVDEPGHRKSHEENMVAALQLLSESGVTSLYDAGNFGFEDLVYGFMAGLEAEGKLPVRYEGTYQVFTPERRHSAVSEMKRYRELYAGERLQFNTVKLFMDGIYQNRTSSLLEPYLDDPSYVGDTLLSVPDLRDFLLELSAERLDIHIHAEGDLAVRRALGAVEKARDIAGDEFYTRVTLSHLGLIDPADLPRMKDLDVIANYTPWWFTTEENDAERISLGENRFGRMFDPKSLFDAGINVTLSSDEWWGGELLPTYLNPYFGMQVGHTRKYPGEWRDKEELIRPPLNGQLSIQQLILGYTRNGAYQLRMESEIGSIETGKLADLVILNDDLFDMNSDRIWKVKPAAVLMEGKVIQGGLEQGYE